MVKKAHYNQHMRKWLAPVVPALLAVAVNLNLLANGFVYDDGYILQYSWFRSASHIPDIFQHSLYESMGVGGRTAFYRPLSALLEMACYNLFGNQAWGYHLVSILLHAGCTVMVFLIASEIASGENRETEPWRDMPFWAAMLFAVLPIHCEAVAWISGNNELAIGLSGMLSFWLYLRNRIGWSVAAFLAAVFFKEVASMMVMLFLAWELVRYREDPQRPATAFFRTMPWFFVPVALYTAMRYQALGGLGMTPVEAEMLPRREMLYSWFYLLGDYLRALIYPYPFSIYHEFQPITRATDWRFFGGVLAVAILLSVAAMLWRRGSRLWFAAFWIVAPLAPMLVFNRSSGNVFGERYLYLPSAGFCWLAGALIVWWQRRMERPAVAAIGGLLLVALGALATASHNPDYRNDVVLWQGAVAAEPRSVAARENLAGAYLSHGQAQRALPLYAALVRERPLDYDSMLSYGTTLASTGRLPEARAGFERAAMLRPSSAVPWYNLGLLSETAGDPRSAERCYRRALELDPASPSAHENLGILLAEQKHLEEAAAHFRAAGSLVNLGKVLAMAGNPREAEAAYRQALDNDKNDAEAWYLLGTLLNSQGRGAEAAECIERMRRLLPDSKWKPPVAGKQGPPRP